MDLEKNLLRDVALKTLIDRGSAEILEEDDQGIFVKDKWSLAFYLVCEDYDKGIRWLEKHRDRNYEILMVFRKDLRDYAIDNFNLYEEMDCKQAVWTKPEPPERSGVVDIRPATEEDIPFLRENYEEWDDEWCLELFSRGNLFVAWKGDTPVGFIGEHLEGTIGLLNVLPEYRNQGIAAEMEAFMIEYEMNKGIIPFGHVLCDNEKSLALQSKMGFDFWDGNVYWLFSYNLSDNDDDKELEWEELGTEHILQDEWMDLRKTAYRLPNGLVFDSFYNYTRGDYVVIVATDEEGRYICVRQFRQGIKAVTTEFPAGGIEEGEDHLETAKRELLEETGYASEDWEYLMSVPSHATISSDMVYLFRAKNCRKVSGQNLDITESLNIKRYDANALELMIKEGKFQQAVHIMAWLLTKESD